MTTMRDAFARAGAKTEKKELYSLIAQLRGQKKTITQIQAMLRPMCLRRPALIDTLIDAYVLRVIDPDMSFRRESDGGQEQGARKGRNSSAPDNFASSGDPDQAGGAKEGQASNVGDKSSEGQNRYDNVRHAGASNDRTPPDDEESHSNRVREDQAAPAQSSGEVSPSLAGSVLAKHGHQMGAGALRPRAYEMRDKIRGESWLLSYQLPNGPQLMSLRAGEVPAMSKRLFREAGEHALAVILLREIELELGTLGNVQPDTVIGKLLPPAFTDRLARTHTPEIILRKGREVMKELRDKLIEAPVIEL